MDTGCEIVGVVGTSHETVREPAETFGARGYIDLLDALEVEQPEFVAICSPIDCHREQLEMVAARGCHCLCDKPLWWDDGAQDRAAVTASLIDRFEEKDLHLAVLTQWPHALPAFFRLHPDLAAHAVESFAMHLGPISTGAAMVLDSMSHPLSILERIAGHAEVDGIAARTAGRTQVISFSYGPVAVEVILTTTPNPPRPAAFAINGRWAHRVVGPGYRMFMEDDGRRVDMPDPMPMRVEEAVNAARAGLPTDRASLLLGMANLERLMRAVG